MLNLILRFHLDEFYMVNLAFLLKIMIWTLEFLLRTILALITQKPDWNVLKYLHTGSIVLPRGYKSQ